MADEKTAKRAAEVLRDYTHMIEESERHHSGPNKGRCDPEIEAEVAEYRALATALESADEIDVKAVASSSTAAIPVYRIPRLIELVSAACRDAAVQNNERAYELWTAVRSELNDAMQTPSVKP